MEGPWVQKNAQKETMEKYAYSKDVQVVLGSMVKDLLLTQPSNPIPYMIDWLKAEDSRRKGNTVEVTAASEEHPTTTE